MGILHATMRGERRVAMDGKRCFAMPVLHPASAALEVLA